MKYSWFTTVLPIAAIFSFRMFGLFMLIPVFTLFAVNLEGATPMLIGFAFGSYGLSQGILQMPFGLLSDRFGRKEVLTVGLLFFAAGSLLGANSHSIYTMILARILQGMGAVGSVLIALLADLTPKANRTRAMAGIGGAIGLSFILAMILSPILTYRYGLTAIFYLTAFFAFFSLILLYCVIPTPKRNRELLHDETNLSLIKDVIYNKQLQGLNAGIFFQHYIFTATFFIIPLLLQQQLRQGAVHQQWHFYLPQLLFSFLLMLPLVFLAEKKQYMKSIFITSILVVCLTQFFLCLYNQSWFVFCGLLFVYFIAFNFLEASLPAMISKRAAATVKGTAMGVYSSSQFLGIFAGGAVSGLLYQFLGKEGIFFGNSLISLIWLVIAYSRWNE